MEKTISRRNFIAYLGAAAMSMGAAGALSGCAGKASAEAAATTSASNGASVSSTLTSTSTGKFVPAGGSFADGALDLGWTGTPAAIEAVGGSTMPLAELNRRRKAYIASKTKDHVCEDGSVIPALYEQVGAKINSLGTGCLESTDKGVFPDAALVAIMADMNEEQARFYLAMPCDINFNVVDASVESGQSVDKCYQLLKDLHTSGYIAQHERNDGMVYHCFPLFQGLAEMSELNHFFRATPKECNPNTAFATMPGLSPNVTWLEGGTPVFHTVPVNESIVEDGSKVLPYDDMLELLKTKKTLGLGPCVCRYTKAKTMKSPTLPPWEAFINTPEKTFDYFDETIGQYLMNCIYMDDEAENGISMGYVHKASLDEVLKSFERSKEAGYIVHVAGGKRAETICMCHIDGGCGICNMYAKLGSAVTNYTAFNQEHHYALDIDFNACNGCGKCVDRCTMNAVTMGDDGKPKVGVTCLACGQCATVCPTGARKLVNRRAEDVASLPESFVDDNMTKAAYRFEHGLVG